MLNTNTIILSEIKPSVSVVSEHLPSEIIFFFIKCYSICIGVKLRHASNRHVRHFNPGIFLFISHSPTVHPTCVSTSLYSVANRLLADGKKDGAKQNISVF